MPAYLKCWARIEPSRPLSDRHFGWFILHTYGPNHDGAMPIEVALAIGAFEASIVYRHARRLIRTDTHGDTHDACTTRKGYISLRHTRQLGGGGRLEDRFRIPYFATPISKTL